MPYFFPAITSLIGQNDSFPTLETLGVDNSFPNNHSQYYQRRFFDSYQLKSVHTLSTRSLRLANPELQHFFENKEFDKYQLKTMYVSSFRYFPAEFNYDVAFNQDVQMKQWKKNQEREDLKKIDLIFTE